MSGTEHPVSTVFPVSESHFETPTDSITTFVSALSEVVATFTRFQRGPESSASVGMSLPSGQGNGSIPAQGRQIGERKRCSLARRRLQRGYLYLRKTSWFGRWREDVLDDGRVRRRYRNVRLGTLAEFPTEKLAQRELDSRTAEVNALDYRPLPTITFSVFSNRWKTDILIQHKPSHQATVRSQLHKHLEPFFGSMELREMQTADIQRFFTGVKKSPKTVRNICVTLQAMWRTARAWGYVSHDPFAGVVLPKRKRSQRFFFSLAEIQRILAEAKVPDKVFFWLAAETAMRAGELCGLRVDAFDLDRRMVFVKQSVWHGRIQDPKSDAAIRSMALSTQLVGQLRELLQTWRPNDLQLIFATSRGTPWDAGLVVRRKLRPLLRSLGIQEAGLHAFRHANASLMDRLGTPLKVRQQRMGHADVRLTLQVYSQAVGEDHVRVAEQLGEMLNRCEPKVQEKGIAPGSHLAQSLLN
jgi:integrase